MIQLKNKIKNIFFSNDNNPKHQKSLDGLRGIAVLMVLLSHSSNNDIYLFNLNFSGVGTFGDFLFFLLSSCLLDRQIAKSLIVQKTNKSYRINYSLRRVMRIYTLFISMLIFWYLLDFVLQSYKFYIFIFLTLLFSSISYLLIEKPLLSIRFNNKFEWK